MDVETADREVVESPEVPPSPDDALSAVPTREDMRERLRAALDAASTDAERDKLRDAMLIDLYTSMYWTEQMIRTTIPQIPQMIAGFLPGGRRMMRKLEKEAAKGVSIDATSDERGIGEDSAGTSPEQGNG